VWASVVWTSGAQAAPVGRLEKEEKEEKEEEEKEEEEEEKKKEEKEELEEMDCKCKNCTLLRWPLGAYQGKEAARQTRERAAD